MVTCSQSINRYGRRSILSGRPSNGRGPPDDLAESITLHKTHAPRKSNPSTAASRFTSRPGCNAQISRRVERGAGPASANNSSSARQKNITPSHVPSPLVSAQRVCGNWLPFRQSWQAAAAAMPWKNRPPPGPYGIMVIRPVHEYKVRELPAPPAQAGQSYTTTGKVAELAASSSAGSAGQSCDCGAASAAAGTSARAGPRAASRGPRG